MKNTEIVFLSAIVLAGCSSPEKKPASANTDSLVLAKGVTAISQECDPFALPVYTDSSYFECRMAIDSILLRKIIDKALNGRIKAYARPEDTIPLSVEALKTRCKPRHSYGFLVDRQTGKETPMERDFNRLDDMMEMRFKEDWMLNPDNAGITKKILAYGIFLQKIDSRTGEFKGMESFFWVKNDNAVIHSE